jgi:hypothetical protein
VQVSVKGVAECSRGHYSGTLCVIREMALGYSDSVTLTESDPPVPIHQLRHDRYFICEIQAEFTRYLVFRQGSYRANE